MPQLEIQTFISQYMWFFFGNFFIVYTLIYTKFIPNIHTRNFIINELSFEKKGPVKINENFSAGLLPKDSIGDAIKTSVIETNSISAPKASFNTSMIKKEIHYLIIKINYNSSASGSANL
uniref:ATP synthase F0 subunit 8 n=1 Tax=Nuclearia simplex TaxID=154970 RepID=M1JF14_9EUKA|nr:ATP synthase F0 subunit 8 [Nuclearia simplex]AGE93668.1 ATP synthase F0 subunit 8 [Nuclearia simplex]